MSDTVIRAINLHGGECALCGRPARAIHVLDVGVRVVHENDRTQSVWHCDRAYLEGVVE